MQLLHELMLGLLRKMISIMCPKVLELLVNGHDAL